MKLLSSFVKELKLASQSFYFMIEIVFAIIILVLVVFAMPENFNEKKNSEYIHFNSSTEAQEYFLDQIEDLDGIVETEEIKNEGKIIKADLYETEDRLVYVIDTKEQMISLAENKNAIGAEVIIDESFNLSYEYYTQGYESEKFKNLLLVFHVESMDTAEQVFDSQDVRTLPGEYYEMTDRENILPALLTFNGSLMGLFILASYIFLDKKEGVIKAYAITPSPVWQYLLSKLMVVVLTSIITTLIIVVPVMGTAINYALLLLFILASAMFASGLALFISGFYSDFAQSFGVLYSLMIILGLPIIAYFIPSWDPLWIKFFPSYYIVYGFKEIIIQNGDIAYVLWSTLGLFGVGAILFLLANMRFKKTLSV